ncbi:MAG: hypothetical protein GC160_05425 [Acidobacteria bacterium]|nr:hypothetical protein [Acidobacteriota bacterium]
MASHWNGRVAVVATLLALGGGLMWAQDERPYGLEKRVKWTTSRLVGSPKPPPPYRLVRVFPQVEFKEPVYVAQDPTSERMFVAEHGGKIYSFDPADSAGRKDIFLDWDRRIYSFSFHPRYAENGQVFVFSPTHPDVKGKQLSRVSRYTLEKGSNPPRLDPNSEEIIIEWPAGGHNGGEAVIGPDGYLYISNGDSTGGSDRINTGQGVNDLLSVMMRLDVDHPDQGRKYSIPKDNPFVNTPGARPEIWAFGFRNPWRFSFDPVTGRPWVGDVGQDLWEMIELSYAGANHGWSVREGTYPFHPHNEIGPTPLTDPIVQHHHTECRSITGGYVYQGDKFPELKGAYLYGDYQYGKMWGLRYDYKAEKVIWHKELVDSPLMLVSFAVGRNGSFYGLDYTSGGIFELDHNPPPDKKLPPFPRKLSETGLFESVKNFKMAPGVIPYEINAPFWSDGAIKERFFALPGDAKIKFDEEKAWTFDDGAVTVKSFQLELEPGNPASRKRVETRIVLKQEDHWVGYTYAWNDKGTDAVLVDEGGMDKAYKIRDASAPGGVREQVWHYPSREECMFCHSRAAGFVLGLRTQQMNRDQTYGKITDNQLRTLDHIGIFHEPLEKKPEEYAKFADPFDPQAGSVETRARVYLDVNCAMCHVNDGGGNAAIQVSFKTPTDKTKMIGEMPMHDVAGGQEMRVVAPGDPDHSVLYWRMTQRGASQMPPSSTNIVDKQGAELIADWIRSLSAGDN